MSVTLGIDSSGRAAGLCLLRDDEVLHLETLDAGRTHSETLLPLVLAALAAHGLRPADIALYGVAAGPGSFTGLRIGMAMVKGLALPADTPAVGVSTLEAMALAAAEGDVRLSGTVIPALDARRGEVYWAAFDCREGLRRLAPDAAGPASEPEKLVNAAPPPVFFVGDGAEMCYTIYTCGPKVARPPAGFAPQTALGVARLARRLAPAGQAGPALLLRPSYLRLSQAERQRREAAQT